MGRNRLRLAAILALTMTTSRGAAQQQPQPLLPYQNSSLPVEQRVEDLLRRLTLEEKSVLMINGSKPIKRLGIPHTALSFISFSFCYTAHVTLLLEPCNTVT